MTKPRTTKNASIPVLILGNGPSAKLVDFVRLEELGIATVGMNAAYRFWDRFCFRPTYYICMDSVLIKSHVDRIFELIEEGRIQKFFLRDEYREAYPSHAEHPRITWFSEARSAKGTIFDTNMITTGSWSIRWMASEGHRHIATIGIDANYVELIKEAAHIGNKSDRTDLRLEVTQTPKHNPNYFFSDYQQKGDQYNVPNSPDYLEKTGRLVHVDALARARDEIKKAFPHVRVTDCSPIANHGVFPRAPLDRFLSFGDISVATSYHAGLSDDDLENCTQIAIDNASRTGIRNVTIAFEGSLHSLYSRLKSVTLLRLKRLEKAKRLVIEVIKARPNYYDLFAMTRAAGGQISICANADIVFDDEFLNLLSANFSNPQARLLSLTRWNSTDTGNYIQGRASAPPWPEILPHNCDFKQRNFLSFDAYVFNRGLPLLNSLKAVSIGTFGCDSAIAAIHRLENIAVVNPCLSYKTYHKDNKIRDYSRDSGEKQMRVNTESVAHLLLRQHLSREALKGSLEDIEKLRPNIASIGAPMHPRGPVHAYFRLLGTVPWTTSITPKPVVFRRFEFTPASDSEEYLESTATEIINAIDENSFIEIEVRGNNGQHFLGSLKNTPKILVTKERLKFYDWVSVFYIDVASANESQIHSNLLLLARNALGYLDSTALVPQISEGARRRVETMDAHRTRRRILVIDSTPIGHDSATGQIKTVFFASCTPESVLQIWQDKGVSAPPRALRYDKDWTRNDLNVSDESTIIEIALQFQPEVIYFRPIDSEPLLGIALKLSEVSRAPLVIHMMDDWPQYLAKVDTTKSDRMMPRFVEVLKRAALHLTISEEMAVAYQQRFGWDWIPLANGVDPQEIPSKDWPARSPFAPGTEFQLVYMGGVAKNMNYETVCAVAECVSAMSTEYPIVMNIHTMPWYMDSIRTRLGSLQGVQILPLVNSVDYPKTLTKADSLLIAYNFDQESRAYTSLSLANKLPECLAAGVPVLGIGPGDCATMRVLQESGGGIVLDHLSETGIRRALLSLLSNQKKAERLGQLGRAYVEARLSRRSVTGRFTEIIEVASAKAEPRVEAETISTGHVVGRQAELHGAYAESFSNSRLLRLRNRWKGLPALIIQRAAALREPVRGEVGQKTVTFFEGAPPPGVSSHNGQIFCSVLSDGTATPDVVAENEKSGIYTFLIHSGEDSVIQQTPMTFLVKPDMSAQRAKGRANHKPDNSDLINLIKALANFTGCIYEHNSSTRQ